MRETHTQQNNHLCPGCWPCLSLVAGSLFCYPRTRRERDLCYTTAAASFFFSIFFFTLYLKKRCALRIVEGNKEKRRRRRARHTNGQGSATTSVFLPLTSTSRVQTETFKSTLDFYKKRFGPDDLVRCKKKLVATFFFCSGNHTTPFYFFCTKSRRQVDQSSSTFHQVTKQKNIKRVPDSRHNLIFFLCLFIYFVCGQHFQGLAAIYRQIQTFFKTKKNEKTKQKNSFDWIQRNNS